MFAFFGFILWLGGWSANSHGWQRKPATMWLFGLIRDSAGNLYGATVAGGERHVGVVFKLKP